MAKKIRTRKDVEDDLKKLNDDYKAKKKKLNDELKDIKIKELEQQLKDALNNKSVNASGFNN